MSESSEGALPRCSPSHEFDLPQKYSGGHRKGCAGPGSWASTTQRRGLSYRSDAVEYCLVKVVHGVDVIGHRPLDNHYTTCLGP